MRPHRQQPTRLPRPWDSPGKNTGVSKDYIYIYIRKKKKKKILGIDLIIAGWLLILHFTYFESPWITTTCIMECESRNLEIPGLGDWLSVQFSSATQSCPSVCDPMDCSRPDLAVHHQLLELAQTQVHWVEDAIQPSHPLLSPSPPAFNISQHQGLFQWINTSHQVAKVLELQHQSFQWIFRTDFL